MPDTKPDEPLDLSIFDDLDCPPRAAAHRAAGSAPAGGDRPAAAPEPEPERLVEFANLSPEDLAAAQASAAKVDFRNTATLLAHGEGVLAGIASLPAIAHRRAAGRRRRVGRIAAA